MFFQKIRLVLLHIIALFRRAYCCFPRRRQHCLLEPEPDTLQYVNVVVDYPSSSAAGQGTSTMTKFNERDWNLWDDNPRTVENHIGKYRQHMANPLTPLHGEPEPDFFLGLTPKIKPQTKLYLGDGQATTEQNFSRLQAHTDVCITMNADLEDWVDDNAGMCGWDELDNEQTKRMIREKRRELRSNRYQQQQQQHQQNAAENFNQAIADTTNSRMHPVVGGTSGMGAKSVSINIVV